MGKRPTHAIYLVSKATKIYTKVGVGWESYPGRLSFTLEPGTVLDWRMMEDYYLNANVIDYEGKSDSSGSPDMNDIPF